MIPIVIHIRLLESGAHLPVAVGIARDSATRAQTSTARMTATEIRHSAHDTDASAAGILDGGRLRADAPRTRVASRVVRTAEVRHCELRRTRPGVRRARADRS